MDKSKNIAEIPGAVVIRLVLKRTLCINVAWAALISLEVKKFLHLHDFLSWGRTTGPTLATIQL